VVVVRSLAGKASFSTVWTEIWTEVDELFRPAYTTVIGIGGFFG
jgi:hypothetical protein